jgi:hypothetical protein
MVPAVPNVQAVQRFSPVQSLRFNVQRKTDSEGELARFKNSQMVKMSKRKQRRDVGRVTEMVESEVVPLSPYLTPPLFPIMAGAYANIAAQRRNFHG